MAKHVHEVRIGLIRARIWRKRTRSGLRHTLSVVRLYRDGDVWKESKRFGRDDLPVVRLVLDRAYTWVLVNGNSMSHASEKSVETTRRRRRELS
jgi:hypothetical protein